MAISTETFQAWCEAHNYTTEEGLIQLAEVRGYTGGLVDTENEEDITESFPTSRGSTWYHEFYENGEGESTRIPHNPPLAVDTVDTHTVIEDEIEDGGIGIEALRDVIADGGSFNAQDIDTEGGFSIRTDSEGNVIPSENGYASGGVIPVGTMSDPNASIPNTVPILTRAIHNSPPQVNVEVDMGAAEERLRASIRAQAREIENPTVPTNERVEGDMAQTVQLGVPSSPITNLEEATRLARDRLREAMSTSPVQVSRDALAMHDALMDTRTHDEAYEIALGVPAPVHYMKKISPFIYRYFTVTGREEYKIMRMREHRRKGYGWAAGELLSGDHSIAYVEGRVQERDPFDTGAREALQDWIDLQNLHEADLAALLPATANDPSVRIPTATEILKSVQAMENKKQETPEDNKPAVRKIRIRR